MVLKDTKQEDLPVMTNLLNERLVPLVIKGANVLILLNKCFPIQCMFDFIQRNTKKSLI